MWARRIAATLAAVLCWVSAGGAKSLIEPHHPGWEQAFTVTWEAAEWRGRPAVRGEIVNRSGDTAVAVRLLVDGLDGQGQVTYQTVVLLSGDVGASGRTSFEVLVPSRAPAYRVRVYSFDWIQQSGPQI